ncbi:hypothetical protein KFK09_025877 [Dendrobium nobile]|uniref:Uncharacterized protein n=1 Tax=Dendrobium nobile TaxID=94219 RepID=A0A8T3A517_DENNO|nr:hypothetical protein KFK09_025877 [Dendrobium nobile]
MEEEGRIKIPPFRSPPPAKISQATSLPAIAADEEEKIEKFCELINNLKALSHIWKSEAPRKRKKSESLLWKPAFEWEDFAGGSDGLHLKPRNEGDGQKKSRKTVEEEVEAESVFDLNLGL